MTLRTVLHLDLDAFFVSVERLKDASLCGKPVVVGGISERGVVSSCSYEARKKGVHSAMPIMKAKKLCPEALFIKGDHESYSKYSKLVTEIIRERAPLFEKASIDEFYLELTGLERYFGVEKWAWELRDLIVRETGLPVSAGLSSNKLVSKIATGEAKPFGKIFVPHGKEQEFLAPLPVSKIPGAGKVTCQRLSEMGINTIRALGNVSKGTLERKFGKYGVSLWYKARGIHNGPVRPYYEQKSLSKECTFYTDTKDIDYLRILLISLTEKLAFGLRKLYKLTACIAVKIRYSDFRTFTLQKHVPYTASDHELIMAVVELFKKIYSGNFPLRLIGVRFSSLIYADYQAGLFDNSVQRMDLLHAVDRIRRKYGVSSVGTALTAGFKRQKN